MDDHQVIVSSVRLLKPLSSKQVTTIISNLTREQKHQEQVTVLLLLDKDAVAGMLHLKACIHFALRSFTQQINIAKKIDAEIMLYLAGVRQINKAIPLVGISEKTRELLLVQLLDKTPHKEDSTPFFDFGKFLTGLNIPFENHQDDIDSFHPREYTRLLAIHHLDDALIELFSPQTTNERKVTIEKLVIEKSALLELQK
ncbi:MAG: hypothetical protein K9W42_10480 [Candidatus Heimdallarchaeota archaeon]|nr:hypothetical protein [Candidatus Heimdallarchaeota archaeon]